MNRTEAAALASRKAQENRRQRKLTEAAALLREASWVVFPAPGQVVKVDTMSQFQRDVTLFTVEVPNGALTVSGPVAVHPHCTCGECVDPERNHANRQPATDSARHVPEAVAEVKVPTLADGGVPTWASGADQ